VILIGLGIVLIAVAERLTGRWQSAWCRGRPGATV